MALDLLLLAGVLSRQLPYPWDFYNGHWLEALYPLLIHIQLFSESLFILEVSEHCEVIRRVRRDTGHHACAFLHRDSGHGEGVHEWVLGEGGLALEANQVFSLDSHEGFDFIASIVLDHFLKCHVESRAS